MIRNQLTIATYLVVGIVKRRRPRDWTRSEIIRGEIQSSS